MGDRTRWTGHNEPDPHCRGSGGRSRVPYVRRRQTCTRRGPIGRRIGPAAAVSGVFGGRPPTPVTNRATSRCRFKARGGDSGNLVHHAGSLNSLGSGSGDKGLPLHGPAEGFRHGGIEVSDETLDPVRGAKVMATAYFSLAPIRRGGLSASCAAAAHPFRAEPSRA